MATTQYFVCLTLLFSGALAYPAASPNFTSPSGNEIFWFPNDKGELVPAFLKGGPPQASLNAIEDDVEFWLYKNGATPGVLIRPDCSDCLGNFVSGAPLVVISHGFSGDHTGFGDPYRRAISGLPGSTNVVFINWGKLAGAPWYETAANNVEPVGLYTARLLNFLIARGLTSVNLIHFIGHSLGSHVANFAGRGLTGGKMARITALDPALPLFGERGDDRRIDPSDASHVVVLHTAMGTLLDGGLAFTEPRGHVDFYPNSGKNQPGCGVDAFGACSHGRANDFFVESITNTRAFSACKCNNWDEYSSGRCLCLDQEYMGWGTPSSARDLYYLRTNANPPYGQG
ncbi:Hepatic triacylglycerol lipase [Orchesella cincta]|uniref:Hepatic triacylglycerol lipase n=1 Tax=Orchesella cincta TaxID=48709 RepID=A0A1D2NIT7_ORCCI|nr:Hepatic triacylglycerol lipase [Orchesella cincta]